MFVVGGYGEGRKEVEGGERLTAMKGEEWQRRGIQGGEENGKIKRKCEINFL